MSKLTYIRCGDYDIPNLKLSVQPETSIGKYGRMRKSYLKEHRPILYNQLLMSEELYPHLLEIDRTAQERVDTMLPHMMEAAGVTEELKACDPMRWVGLMNTLTAQIEEILIIITGLDRPGLTASITEILSKYDVTILDIGDRKSVV